MPFSLQDEKLIFSMAERLTENCQDEGYRRQALVNNVMRRMHFHGIDNVQAYLAFAQSDSEEHSQLISALTIHKTSWFRERLQFVQLRHILLRSGHLYKRPLQIVSLACSTGEEVYSLAMFFENLRDRLPGLDYHVLGLDIDPISIMRAKKALYNLESQRDIPQEYQRHILVGSGPTAGLITIDKHVRQKCHFATTRLNNWNPAAKSIDVLFCRNVLIYFHPTKVKRILARLSEAISEDGVLCVGQVESFPPEDHKLVRHGYSCYSRKIRPKKTIAEHNEAEILCVESTEQRNLEVFNTLETFARPYAYVEDTKDALAYMAHTSVRLLLINIHAAHEHLPRWIAALRENNANLPILLVGDAQNNQQNTIVPSLEAGAQDYVSYSALRSHPQCLIELIEPLLDQGHLLRPTQLPLRSSQTLKACHAIFIGASTGGTQALCQLLEDLPQPCPPILVVQHIEKDFLKPFAARLASISRLRLSPMQEGERLKANSLYMAEGDYHLQVRAHKNSQNTQELSLSKSLSKPFYSQRPSVEALFQSAAQYTPQQGWMFAGFLLTGMGKDGAAGMLDLYRKQHMTFTQDEASSVVFGMPGEAIKLGAAGFIGNIPQLKKKLHTLIRLFQNSPLHQPYDKKPHEKRSAG